MPNDAESRPLDPAKLEHCPLHTYEKLRYVDTDRQGDVNDEARRSEALPEPARRVLESLRWRAAARRGFTDIRALRARSRS